MLKRLSAVCALVLILPSLGAAPPKGEKWTEDDVLHAESAADFQVSPDGRWVVWVKKTADEEKGERVSHLVRSSLMGGREVQLTRGPDDCVRPRWSPDGKSIAFLSDRPPTTKTSKPSPSGKARRGDKKEDEQKTQIWLLDSTGGEPWTLTELKRSVAFFAWAGSGAIIFGAKEELSLREKTSEEAKDTTVVVEDEKQEPPVRLFKVEVASGKITRLTDNRDWIQSLAVSPDGKKAVTVHNRSLRFTYDNRVKPAAFLHNLETGEKKQIFKDAKFNLVHVVWARDGKGFYAASQFTTHPRYIQATITELYFHDLKSGETQKVDLDWDRGLGDHTENDSHEGVVPTPDGFLALLAYGVRNRAARYVRTGPGTWKREWLEGEHAGQLFALEASKDGKTVLYAQSKATSPTRWYRATLQGKRLAKPEILVDLNPDLRLKPAARVEVVRWKGARDEEVEGLIYYPHDYKKGKKCPLVVMIHGGPFGVDQDVWEESWAYPVQLFTQKGALVFKPNYHGSSSYGLAFAESIAGGRYYELPLVDIERGVQTLITRGLADPKRVATMGWSNGAILSAALITRNPDYRAASLGAGGAEWVGDWGVCEFGASFSNYYLGKSPIEDPQLYVKMAPLYQFHKVRTPTIIFQGDADRAVPPHHAWSQFRTLQALGKVEVRLVMFPDEEHSLKKLAHQKRKMQEELAWFDRHLFRTSPEDNLALKPDSPLAVALKRKAATRDARGHYGVMVKGTLTPETVTFEGMEVGRFEVTAAQFARFDRSRKVAPGKENYPAAGVPFEQAKAYCQWLSKQTGRVYRLPTKLEASLLYEDRDGDGENTLDHWAGYAPNPEDAARLREKARTLGTGALLSEVGRFRAAGNGEAVFDLGGNVAEWVVTDEGKGRAAGGCAALPAEDKAVSRKPPTEYVGFRVVREKGK
jgi:dipeptidyl aminopeptidase/acylaminoacyl peptidase